MKAVPAAPAPVRAVAGPLSAEAQALHAKALKAIGDRKLGKARELLAELLAAAPHASVARYNYACVLSLLDEPFDALAELERALAAGYANFDHLHTDPDLAKVRQLPSFLPLVLRFDANTPEIRAQREKACRAIADGHIDKGKHTLRAILENIPVILD